VPGRRPGLYLIHQDKGDRHFTYWRDTSAAKLLADDKRSAGGKAVRRRRA
jgi:2-dehydro-3-deoxygluconokinase